jgi:hypothetical protein
VDDFRDEGQEAQAEATSTGVALTRREIVVGLSAASMLATESASAESDGPIVRPARWSRDPRVFGVEIDYLPYGSVAIFPEVLGPTASTEFTFGQNAAVSAFVFNKVSFSDTGTFSFGIGWSRKNGSWLVVGQFGRSNEAGARAEADFGDFIAGKASLKFRLSNVQAGQVVRAFFGPAVEFDRSSGAEFSIKVQIHVPDGQRPPLRPEIRFAYALRPLAAFGLWAFDGRLRINSLDIGVVEPDEGDGASVQGVRHRDALNHSRPWPRSLVYLGGARAADLKWAPETDNNPYWVGKLAAGAAAKVALDGAFERFSVRQWGPAGESAAILRAPLAVTLVGSDRSVPGSTFYLSEAIAIRHRIWNGTREEIYEKIGGRIQDKPFQLSSAYGPLTIEGDPSPPKTRKDAEGRGASVASREALLASEKGLTQLVLKARDDIIEEFDARARLLHIAIPLADGSFGASHSDKNMVWSRLDLAGSEVAFRLPVKSASKSEAPAARGVVTICEAPAPLPALDQNVPVSAAVALDGAKLAVRRSSDNLALEFQFARMALEIGKDGARIVPNLRLSGAGQGYAAAAARETARRLDDRPLLIVNFPPQHVAERAYSRQINDGIALPDAPMSETDPLCFTKRLLEWRNAGMDVSLEVRRKLRDDQEGVKSSDKLKEEYDAIRALLANPSIWDERLGLDGATLNTLRDRWDRLPAEQRDVYLGPNPLAMDPDVRAVTLEIWRAYIKNTTTPAIEIENLIARLPDVELEEAVIDDIKRRLNASRDTKTTPTVRGSSSSGLDPKPVGNGPNLDNEIHKEKIRRSRDYKEAVACAAKFAEKPGIPIRLQASLATYRGREPVRAAARAEGTDRDFLTKLRAFVQSAIDEPKGEKFEAITQARLSGATRLVFRFNTADPVDGKRARRHIDYSIDGLTDWGEFDLAVCSRAETVEKPVGSRIPHLAFRAAEGDAAVILKHKGIKPGRSIEGRLRDIRESLRPPSDDETAIELPFRLTLSPDQFARFRTRRWVDCRVLSDDKDWAVTPHLWSTELNITAAPSVVRAIWSPDFRPEVFGYARPPERGSRAPWLTIPDADENFRTSLDAYDRHEIVALTSVYGLPVMGRRDEGGVMLADSHQFEPPDPYKLRDLKYYTVGNTQRDLSGIYIPKSLDIKELRLTALGGSLRHDTGFVPPASALKKNGDALFDAFSVERWRQITVLGRDIEVEVVYKGFLFPLGVRAALVKLTERRFVRNPATGHVSAFLIQRKFIRIGNPEKNFPALGQPDKSRRFPVNQLSMLTTVTPDIVDPENNRSGSAWSATNPVVMEHPSGRIDFQAPDGNKLPGLAFWPRATPGVSGNIAFEYVIDSKTSPLRMPLVFVDNVAANRADFLQALTAYYNAGPAGLRVVDHGGAKRRYAEENADGECEFETYRWEFKAEGRAGGNAFFKENQTNLYFAFDPLLQGADQPPFYPFVDVANIRVGQAERFVGRSLGSVDMEFDPDYVNLGFGGNNIADKYLKVKSGKWPIDMGDSGDRSGGIARPAMDVTYLSRRTGLFAGDPKPPSGVPAAAVPVSPDADAGPPPSLDLQDFFSDDAKLLGLISFKDLLKLSGAAAPELKERVESATEETLEFLRQNVIPDVERAIDRLDLMWRRAQEGAQKATPTNAELLKLDLDKVYPDIASALKDLRLKLRLTKAAAGLGAIQAVTELQASGRRFVNAVNRLLADPIAPLRQDFRDRFRKLSGDFSKLSDGIGETVRQAVMAVKTEVASGIGNFFSTHQAELAPFGRLLVTLPPPHDFYSLLPSEPEPRRSMPESVASALDGATRSAVETFIRIAIDNPGNPDTALQNAADKAIQEVGSAAAAADGSLKNILNAYRSAMETKRAKPAREMIAAFGGPLYKDISETLPKLAALERESRKLDGDIVERLSRMFGEILAAQAKMLAKRTFEERIAGVCDTATSAFGEFVTANSAVGLSALVNAFEQVADKIDSVRTTEFQDLMTRFRGFREGGDQDVGNICRLPSGGTTPSAGMKIYAFARMRELFAIKADLVEAVGRLAADVGSETATTIADTWCQELIDTVYTSFVESNEAVAKSIRKLRDAIPEPAATPADAHGAIVADLKRTSRSELEEFAKELDEARTRIAALRQGDLATARPRLADLGAIIVGDGSPGSGLAAILRRREAALLELVGKITSAADGVSTQLTRVFTGMTAPIFEQLKAKIYDPLLTFRSNNWKTSLSVDNDVLSILAKLLKGPDGRPLAGLFVVGDNTAKPGDIPQDQLTRDVADLAVLSKPPAGLSTKEYVAKILAFTDAFEKQTASPVLLVRNLSLVLTAVLRGDISQFVDLKQVRREIDEAVRKMVPARISRSYDFNLGLGDVGELVSFDPPRAHPKGLPGKLVLRASGTVDLLNAKHSTFDAEGFVPGFKLKLLPAFDVATIHFPPCSFSSGSGKPFDFSMRVERVQLGAQVKFLEELQEILGAPKDGTGFFLRLLTGRNNIGVVAGYAFALSPITLGNMYIDNLSLNVAAELPFDKGDARFVVSISRPEAPFMISAAPYAGAGHFGLIANPNGIVGFEASFQFGGGGGFSFGPLSGSGRISVGIFVRTIEGYTDLYGLFYAGGSARIACFSVSAQLNVRLQQSGANVEGEAIFTYSFSIGIKDIEFSVTVFKRESGGKNANTASLSPDTTGFADVIDLDRSEYREAFASAEPQAKLSSLTFCKAEHFGKYQAYFARFDEVTPRSSKPAAWVFQ